MDSVLLSACAGNCPGIKAKVKGISGLAVQTLLSVNLPILVVPDAGGELVSFLPGSREGGFGQRALCSGQAGNQLLTR